MRQSRVGSYWVGLLCTVLGSSAAAQTISVGQALDMREGEAPSGLTLFTTFDYGSTAYTASFDSTATSADKVAGVATNEAFELEDRNQRLSFTGPQFGARWAITDEIQVKGAVGACWLALTPSDTAFGAIGNAKYGELRSSLGTLRQEFDWRNPGFSTTVGGDYIFLSFQHLSAKAGLQFNYLSVSGLSGYRLSGKDSTTVSSGTTIEDYREVSINDITMHLFTIQPHVGLEWRPFRSFLVNSFGLHLAYVLSAGKVSVEDEAYSLTGTTTNIDQTRTQDVGFGVSLNQILGGYYGWYLGIPHFGNLGAEIQFGSRLVGTFSYQYVF